MGKWYDSHGLYIFGKTKAYQEIAEPHETVHNCVFSAFEFVKNNSTLKGNNPNKIYDNFAIMENASQVLFTKLDEMLEQYKSEK